MRRIDNLQFCRDRSILSGSVRAEELTRLALLNCAFEEVCFELRGAMDKHGRGRLQLAIFGQLELTCQRCLGPLFWELDASAQYVLASNPQDFDFAGEDEWDAIAIDRQMSIEDLIEDQVILEMPMIPRHEACDLPASN